MVTCVFFVYFFKLISFNKIQINN